jgi:hypothetical protein
VARKRGFILGPTIHRIVKGISAERTDGLWSDSRARLLLAQFLRENPEYLDEPFAQASRHYKRYQKLVRPRPTSPGGFFHPERVIPGAPGESCLIGRAGIVQLDFWQDHDETAKRRADDAHERKRDYWNSRRRAFTATGLLTFEDIERNIFGWTPPPTPTIPEELIDPDDDDEGGED